MTEKYKHEECGWIGTSAEMDADAYPMGPDGEEAWSNHICPKCRAWLTLSDYTALPLEGAPEVKARPILMSAPMVRACVEGRKTQTRRAVKGTGLQWLNEGFTPEFAAHPENKCCPYGLPGDLLYVRETFVVENDSEYVGYNMPLDDRPVQTVGDPEGEHFHLIPHYRATDTDVMVMQAGESCDDFVRTKWTPGIHMPRKFSRLTLEIKEVHCERLQDITDVEAIAEGCFFTDYGMKCFHHGKIQNAKGCPAPDEHHIKNPGWYWDKNTHSDQCLNTPRSAYGNLWNTINGPASWDSNPWVWVIDFSVHAVNVDQFLKERAA